MTGRTTRADRLAHPTARDAVRAVAEAHGACLHPVQLRRINLETRETEQVLIPCGATLASKCPPCAERAKVLRAAQCAEGWHLETEPITDPPPPDEVQAMWVEHRAQAQAMRDRAEAAGDDTGELDELIGELDQEITGSGLRGKADPARPRPRRHRSTRRRQDAPDLPKRRISTCTVGRTYTAPNGKVFRPSMFLTLTCPSYGRIGEDGTPIDPAAYDYMRAARDALHFAALFDRFTQNLRRVLGYDVQYFATIEPQRRLAPHVHIAMRGTLSRTELRQIIAATYHQVWWPSTEVVRFEGDYLPVWYEARGGYLDPETGELLPTWDEALDAIGPDDEPLHVARFGAKFDAQGVLAASKDSARCISYLTKYLTKQLGDCHQPDGDAQRGHVERLAEALRYEPCSPTCANWLRYGIQPKNPRPGLVPGACKGKAHRYDHLGYAGRRVLISRKWSGKTLADHRGDRQAWLTEMLGLPATDPTRYRWEQVQPDDEDYLPSGRRLLRSVADRLRGKTLLPKPGDEPKKLSPPKSRQPGGQRDDQVPDSPSGAAADRGRGRRAAWHNRAIPSPPHRRTAHSVRPHWPPRPHPRISSAQVHRGRAGRTDDAIPAGSGGLMTGKRRFGRVRRLPSGRYQARYLGPDGVDRPAPQTFGTKREAQVWLTLKEGEIKHGDWLDPSAGSVPFAKYAADWLGQGQFSPKTAQLYELLLRLHLVPTFGEMNIGDIRQEDVRTWRAAQLRTGPQQERPFGPVTVAKAYRLLRAILNTAVRDKRLRENPCQIRGADKESSPERPVLSVPEVYRLADAIEPRYRALVLLATFGNLRWGELAGLRRRNLDLDNRCVRVTETVYEFGQLVKGTPKSKASIRTVVLPELIIPELWRHLDTFAGNGPDGFVFVGVKGGQLRRSNFSKPWARALAKAGLPAEVHVHDLRHTGNTLTGEAGASLAELMNRMGHSSTRAARVYLHAREERDRQLATTLDKMARRELRRSSSTRSGSQSGTQRARERPKGSERGTSDHGQ